MPFFKRKDSKDSGSTNGSSSVSQNGNNEKINYKSRLEHKMYLVSALTTYIKAVASVVVSLAFPLKPRYNKQVRQTLFVHYIE